MEQPYERQSVMEHNRIMAKSFQQLLGRPFSDEARRLSPAGFAKYLWDAPFVVLAHTNAADPVFSYANRKAQNLFGYAWEEFMQLPSRLSAEPVSQEDRERLLRAARERGYIEDYQGVRIAKDGSRFRIEKVILWNVSDDLGNPVGQAAFFEHWRPLDRTQQPS